MGDEAGSYEFLDHPADVRLRLQGRGPGPLYRTAVRALCAWVTDGEALDPGPGQEIELSAADPAELLVCLLNEALYVLESAGRPAMDLEVARVTDTSLGGVLRLGEPRSPDLLSRLREVKAATYNELGWERDEGDRITAQVTLDL